MAYNGQRGVGSILDSSEELAPLVLEGETEYVDESTEFGGPEERKILEKKLDDDARYYVLNPRLTPHSYIIMQIPSFTGALLTRKELGLRTAILYCGNLMSNAFGGLLAAGILSGMDGKLGQAGWRPSFSPGDFPATTRWLSPDERKLAMLRMSEDVGEADEENQKEEHNQLTGLKLAVTDWKVWWLAFAMLSQVLTLAATLGFESTTVTLLLTAPPWFFATFISFLNARHADSTGERFWHISCPILLGILGFVISLSTMNTAARYLALWVILLTSEAQSYAGFVVLYAWQSNSLPRPPAKRAVALALINAWSQLGNIAGSYIWATSWGPTYRKSYGICVATAGLTLIMCYIFRQHLISLNKEIERKQNATGRRIKFRYLY
ncbi:hypothetical protein Clacol_000398 [Clathrus columnatus]|uniref:Uncharacterized protein n=1 Tax=Clathrus columnatus TaxID=1419009 RepID=A0AAV4ZWJ3_9AGAM|nr:hypothetical protein Clacol_000398 [Clathrus columnatus]